jgi:hypothetical protein
MAYSNTWLASKVQTLTHRCHLPPPAIFNDLTKTSFNGRTLSHDPKTLILLDLACRNLSHIQTLRIIFGHMNITRGLLRGILNTDRQRKQPLRRLWLENCSLDDFSTDELDHLDLTTLQSIRMRRLSLVAYSHTETTRRVYSRCSGRMSQLQNSIGCLYGTRVSEEGREDVLTQGALSMEYRGDIS